MLSTMVLALLCSTMLSQAATPPKPLPTYPKIVIVLSRSIDVPAQDARMITRRLAEILKEDKVELPEMPEQTAQRLTALGLDAESCQGKRACMASLGQKLGMTFVLGVGVAQIGSDMAMSLDVVRTSDALSVFEQSFVVPSDDPERLLRASRPLAQKLNLIAPKYVPPQPPYAYFTGFQMGLRGDADLLDVPAFVGAATAEYSWRYVGVAVTALLSPKNLGGRLEGKVYPFNFELFRPYAFLGASALDNGVAPRGGIGVQMRLGDHLRLHLDGAAERFLVGEEELRPLALLVGAGAGWRF